MMADKVASGAWDADQFAAANAGTATEAPTAAPTALATAFPNATLATG